MATFALPNYSFRSTLNHALTEAPARRGMAGRAFFGPSPFEVPESAYVVLRGSQELTFRFNYYGAEEDAEDFDRVAARDGSVTVRLGDKTRRILQLSLRRDIREFTPNALGFDVEVLIRDLSEAPRMVLHALRRNAAVIEGIIEVLPPEFVTEVRETAAAQARGILAGT